MTTTTQRIQHVRQMRVGDRFDVEVDGAEIVWRVDGHDGEHATIVCESSTTSKVRANDETRIDGPIDTTVERPREFVVDRRRKWALLAERLSNGQLTARAFRDRTTGNWHQANGWKKAGRLIAAAGGDAARELDAQLASATRYDPSAEQARWQRQAREAQDVEQQAREDRAEHEHAGLETVADERLGDDVPTLREAADAIETIAALFGGEPPESDGTDEERDEIDRAYAEALDVARRIRSAS